MNFQSDQPDKPDRRDRPDEPAFVRRAQGRTSLLARFSLARGNGASMGKETVSQTQAGRVK
jgi:hypothetical protein